MNIIITRNAAIHIVKHDVAPDDIRQAERDPGLLLTRASGAFYYVYARTFAGRRLFIMLEKRPAGWFLKTARNMEPHEKRLHKKKRKVRKIDETDEKEETS